MAINWDQYAKSYSGYGGPQAQAGAAMGAALGKGFAAIPGVTDRIRTAKSDALDETFLPLAQFGAADPGNWGNLTDLPSVQNAGSAYMSWKESLSPRQARVAKRKGLLNPMAFKQEYDARMNMYLPGIISQLEGYKRFNHKTDDEMRELLSKYPHLNRFIHDNTPEDQKALYEYMVPEETWKEWWQDKPMWQKATTVAGPPLTAAYGYSAAKDIGKRGLGGRYNPVGKGKKPILRMTGKGATSAVKGLGWEGKTTALDKKSMKSATAAQRKASSALNQAKKNYKGKKVKFEKTAKGVKLTKSRDAAKLANIAAKKGAAKGPARVVASYVKKHGVSGLIRKVVKKAGVKGAVKLLGRGAISIGLKGTGVGALASLGLDGIMIHQIYQYIKSED